MFRPVKTAHLACFTTTDVFGSAGLSPMSATRVTVTSATRFVLVRGKQESSKSLTISTPGFSDEKRIGGSRQDQPDQPGRPSLCDPYAELITSRFGGAGRRDQRMQARPEVCIVFSRGFCGVCVKWRSGFGLFLRVVMKAVKRFRLRYDEDRRLGFGISSFRFSYA